MTMGGGDLKFDLLKAFRKHLEGIYSLNTAHTYYKRLVSLLDGQYLINTANNIDLEKVLKRLSIIKYRNEFSQSKNALIQFFKYQNINLDNDYLKGIDNLKNKTHKKYRKLKDVDFNKVAKKISYIKNEKMKLSYETIIYSGLRVSELTQITRQNCIIDDISIVFKFIGKGGKNENVKILKTDNPIFFERLKEHIQDTKDDKKIFYSYGYLQSKAKEMDFHCHDLRRAYAKLEYKKGKSKKQVQEKLRHSNIRTTNIYLTSKVKV